MYSTCDKKGSTTSGHTLDGWNPAPPGMYKTSQKPENNRINMDKLQTSPEFLKKTIFEPSTVTWPIVMFRVFQYVKVHHRHGIHKKPQLRHQIGAFRDGLPCFLLWTVSLCYRWEWFAKVWYAKKEFLWGLSVLYVKYQMKTYKKKVNFRTYVFFFTMPPEHSSLGVGIKAPFKETKWHAFQPIKVVDCQLSTPGWPEQRANTWLQRSRLSSPGCSSTIPDNKTNGYKWCFGESRP